MVSPWFVLPFRVHQHRIHASLTGPSFHSWEPSAGRLLKSFPTRALKTLHNHLPEPGFEPRTFHFDEEAFYARLNPPASTCALRVDCPWFKSRFWKMRVFRARVGMDFKNLPADGSRQGNEGPVIEARLMDSMVPGKGNEGPVSEARLMDPKRKYEPWTYDFDGGAF